MTKHEDKTDGVVKKVKRGRASDDKLETVLTSIEDELHKQNSFRRIFVNGLLRGLGTAIGATLLFAIFTSLALHFASTVDMRSYIETILLSS